MQIGTDWKGIVLAKIVPQDGQYRLDLWRDGKTQVRTTDTEKAAMLIAEDVYPEIRWIDK